MTVLQLDKCEVVQVKTADKHGYTALQMGVGGMKEKNVTKPLYGHFASAGVAPKRLLMEFRISEDAVIPAGTEISALHFVPGQHVDVCGTSVGKGMQGVMKLHNFKGQRATHGVSKTHRHAGSTGQCQDPGRVFKGKKMAGRMGGKRVTNRNLWVYKIDPDRNLLYVKGTVPGKPGGFVRVTDARDQKFEDGNPPPFPTFASDDVVPENLVAALGKTDPLNFRL